MSKFAVPVFVVLSGAFLIANSKNENAKIFYKKNVNRILIPFLIFSVLYFSFSMITSLLSGDNIFNPIFINEELKNILEARNRSMNLKI